MSRPLYDGVHRSCHTDGTGERGSKASTSSNAILECWLRLNGPSTPDVIGFEILRGPQTFTMVVGWDERPDESDRFADFVNRDAQLIPKLGVLVAGIGDLPRGMLPPRSTSGVFVAGIAGEGTHQGFVFQPGDIIRSINGTGIQDLAGLRSATESLRTGDAVVVGTERRGRRVLLAFTLE